MTARSLLVNLALLLATDDRRYADRLGEAKGLLRTCVTFRLGSGASVPTNLGHSAQAQERKDPRTNVDHSQDASHVNHSLCASQAMSPNSRMLQTHTSFSLPTSSPMSDFENHQEAKTVHQGEVGQAAAAPTLPPELDVFEHPAAILDVSLDPELRHPLRKMRRGPSLAIRNRAIAFGLPHDAWFSEFSSDSSQPTLRTDSCPTSDPISNQHRGPMDVPPSDPIRT